MFALSKIREPAVLADRLRSAHASTPELMAEIIGKTCRRFPSGRTARIERLIATEAWTDAALALTDLELPQWQVRRIAYDDGEWHCALSRQPGLPDWLDQSIEAEHGDLPLALLSAYLEASRHAEASEPPRRFSVPQTSPLPTECLCCDNFS
jgi:hypothetical protein